LRTREEVPFKGRKVASIFSDEDKPKKLDLFKDEEDIRNCRHCEHFVVNPFLARCGLTQKVVQATDCCSRFTRKEEEPEDMDNQP
jgi:hypothetical protein